MSDLVTVTETALPPTPTTTPIPSPSKTEMAIETVAVKIEAVKETVLKTVGDLSGALLVLVDKMASEIAEIPEVAAILRHVPKFVSAVHTLTVPGPEKRDLVLKALRALSGKLQDSNKITAEFRAQLDDFITITVPVTIDTLLDVVKGRVSFESIVQQAVANPAAVATVLSATITCCTGFFQTKRAKIDAVEVTDAKPQVA